jgi:hypothetical protein
MLATMKNTEINNGSKKTNNDIVRKNVTNYTFAGRGNYTGEVMELEIVNPYKFKKGTYKIKKYVAHGKGKMISTSGKVIYEGQWFNDDFHGFGKLTCGFGEDGETIYVGQFKCGDKDGKGSMKLPCSQKIEKKYIIGKATLTGNWIKDNITSGKIRYPDGSEYDGGIENYQRSGLGTITFPDSTKHIGYWKNNHREGKGLTTFTNGTRLVANWIHDLPMYPVEITYPDSSECDKYEGNCNIDGEPQETGTMKYKNGDIYEGKWHMGKPHGHGTMKYCTGDEYSGHWKVGIIDGKGVMKYDDEYKYIGFWENGMKNGRGVLIDAIGNYHSGYWKNDMLNGKCRYYDRIHDKIFYYYYVDNYITKQYIIETDYNNDIDDSTLIEKKTNYVNRFGHLPIIVRGLLRKKYEL